MKTLKIKDICDKGSSALKQKDVEGQEGKYPVYGAGGYISSIDTYHQDKDYIAIVKDGSGIGRVTFMPAYSSVIGTMQYILPKEGYNIKYISYCLQSLDLAKYKQGAAIPHIYFRDYGERYVNIEESLPEQERIVSLLDAEFAKIDAIKANAEKQLQDAKALFQSALKDYLTLKEGWKYEQMGNVCTFISGYTPAKELLSKSGSIPYYKVSDMNTEGNEVLLNKTSLYLSNAKKIIPKGSVVFPKNGGAIFTNKKRMLVCDSVVDLNTEAIFPNKNIVTTNFLYKLLLSIDLGQFDNGGGLPSINIKKMQSFTIPIPPLSEQERIVSLLDGLSAKIQSLQSNFDTTVTLCNDLKQSILKDIFG